MALPPRRPPAPRSGRPPAPRSWMGPELRRTLRPWAALVPVTALAAGLLFATSAATADGTDLRSDRRLRLTELIALERQDLARRERLAAQLRADVDEQAARVADRDSRVADLAAPAGLEAGAGLQPVRGPGVTVSLDDAPRRPGRPALSDFPDDLVVHQQDVQAVVNALWSGGAEAMTLMGQRVVSTTAVRCVGNTVVLHGRVYSPPFVISAVGDPAALRDALSGDPGVQQFRTYVERFGLGYDVQSSRELDLPAYVGPLELPHVETGGT